MWWQVGLIVFVLVIIWAAFKVLEIEGLPQ